MSEVENLGKLINKYETINEGPSKFGENMAAFDVNAGEALKRLTNSGYDELEQDNLEALMRALSVRDGKTGIWKNPEIDMNDKYNREKQLKDLEQVAKRFQEDRGNNPKTQDENSFRNIFQDIKNGIKGNEAFRHVWNSPE